MESGTHEDLMYRNGFYSNLVNAQTKHNYSIGCREDSFESDEGMELYESDDKSISTKSIILSTPSRSQTRKREISIQVKQKTFNIYLVYLI